MDNDEMIPEYNFPKGGRVTYVNFHQDIDAYRAIYNRNVKVKGTAYVDRMKEWDREKYYKCCDDHLGSRSDYWDNYSAEQINGFMSQYLGERVSVASVECSINKSNGYPIYRIDYGVEE